MTEQRIRVVSDPYRREIRFAVWRDGWLPVTEDTEPDSVLLENSIAHGFLPFVAERIIDALVEEYIAGDQRLHIVFEGTEDEYEELRAACGASKNAELVSFESSDRHLLNARDVLSQIGRIFVGVRDLMSIDALSQDQRMRHRIERFYDASKDVVPLCVIGNYSSGKSTFVNALIGQELLPSGDEPVTARVFQIRDSHDKDSGTIRVTCGVTPAVVRFEGIDATCEGPEPIRRLVDTSLGTGCDNLGQSLISNMRAVLAALNAYEPADDKYAVSDRIDVTVPFRGSEAWTRGHEFVIFDTPGSNSETHEDHAQVLRDAMQDISNGLPLYVCEYSTLDSTDNKALYDQIASIDAIDERFAMVVVNKADSAGIHISDFNEEKREQIRYWAVPRNLNAQGMYFISSVMALGAKCKGELEGDTYAETYETQESKFRNPRSRFYKQLYRFDILPSQIAARVIDTSQTCDDLVLANSGMYCLEQEIGRFAERYAAYDKCNQSRRILADIISETHCALEMNKASLKHELDARRKLMQGDFKELTRRVERFERETIEEFDKRGSDYLLMSTERCGMRTSLTILRSRYEVLNEDSDAMLEKLRIEFESSLEKTRNVAMEAIRAFLKDETKLARDNVYNMICNDGSLSDAMRRNVSSTILSFSDIEVKMEGASFLQENDFRLVFRLLFLPLFRTRKLDLERLAIAYNKELWAKRRLIIGRVKIAAKHEFEAWLNGMCGRALDNAVAYNPTLLNQRHAINLLTEKITDLEMGLDTLEEFEHEVSELIGWHE